MSKVVVTCFVAEYISEDCGLVIRSRGRWGKCG